MKRFFKYVGLCLFAVVFTIYLELVFVLPRIVDLNVFKWELQKLVKEQAKLDVNFENAKLLITPLLSAGISADDISVKLPDGSTVFSADRIKTQVAIPSLLLLTVKVSCAEVENPVINMEILDGKQFKLVSLIESILNEQENNLVVKTSAPPVIDPSLIRIKVPAIKINDYIVAVNDLKSGHKLTLKGDDLILSYNVNKARVITEAELLSDNDEAVKANIDIDTFIPAVSGLDEEDDPAQRIEIPFVNPVLAYRDYNLKSDINTKLKIRQKKDHLSVYGHMNIDDTTMTLSGLTLPESHIGAVFTGTVADINTNIYVANNQNLKLKGKIGYGKKHGADLHIQSQKIYFNDLIILSKAFLDTLHVKNELAELNATGYFNSNADIKTDFKKLKSNGSIIVRNGSISNPKAGLYLKDMNANLIFKDNLLDIVDTRANINGADIVTTGNINDKSEININILTKNLPLGGLYRTFAPVEIKNAYSLNSANLSMDTKITGELKKAAGKINLSLDNLSVTDRKSQMGITNEALSVNISSDFKNIFGEIVNKNLRISVPQTGSVLYNPMLIVNITDKDIEVNRTEVKLNNASLLRILGTVNNYMTSPKISVTADGKFKTTDLLQLLGEQAKPFINARGAIPLKFAFNGDTKKQTLTCQIVSDADNYITPVNIRSLMHEQNILQAKILLKGNRLNIKDTGLFTKISPSKITDNYDLNMIGVREVIGVSGTITNLNTEPFINVLRVSIPKQLNGNFTAFNDSSFTLDGGLLAFGRADNPRTRGNFRIRNFSIPDLYLTAREGIMAFKGKSLDINLNDVFVNGSDFNIFTNISLNPSSNLVINDLRINSRLVNADRLLETADAAAKLVPPAPASAQNAPANIPVVIRNGSINIARAVSGTITAIQTSSRLSMRDNVFYLNNLLTHTFDGTVRGNLAMNLINSGLRINVRGNGLNVENALLALANMKDTLTGTMNFNTNITLRGTTMEEQMKSLKGEVNFHIEDGQLGPFGKIENLILAENIRESEFFQTTLGSVINSMTTIETSHFQLLSGHLLFDNGIVSLNPITSLGKVMCLHIGGEFNLLENTADMKLRGRLASQVSDMLGPIAAVNPVNLVKVTPGLNVVAAKAFTLFCEEITQEEMNSIPDFEKDYSVMSTTKFQVVLRGDAAKPLSLVKSFKWLALASEIEQAQNFVATLPENQEEFIKEQNPTKWEKFIRFFKPNKKNKQAA